MTTTNLNPGSQNHKFETLKEITDRAIVERYGNKQLTVTEVARSLGIGRATLYRKIKSLGLK